MLALLKNQVRIIGGKWRGRKISFLDVDGLRPTADRTRETLFNWLSPFIPHSICLDLFAGSGVLGFEALSRGAEKTILIDKSTLVIQQIQQAQQQLNSDKAESYCMDSIRFLEHTHDSFDIIFLDPPFYQNLLQPSIHLIHERNLLRPQGYLYLEQAKNETPLSLPLGWKIIKEKQTRQVLFQLIQHF